jgi:HEAT repeat protein
MELFGKPKPNVKALTRREDIEGLVEAAEFQDLVWSRDGETRDRGAGVREKAILALGELSTAAGNGTVAAALSDPSDRVRTAAVRVLYAREQAAPLVDALRWLPAHDGTARRLAIEAIAGLNRPEHARALAAAIVRAHGENPPGDDELELLGWFFGHSESSEKLQVIDDLLSALADAREAVAERAEQLLAWLSPAALDGVIAELESGRAAHRAASVLGRIKDSRALEPLLKGLGHGEAHVRAASAAALGELRDPAAVELLMRATRDSDHEVRAQAGWALDHIGVAAVIVGVSLLVRPAIQEALGSGDETRPALEDGRSERSIDVPAASAPEFEGWALDESEALKREAADAAREAAAAAVRETAEALRDETSEAARRDIETLLQQFANGQAAERAATEAAQREATAASARALSFIRSAERQLDDLRSAGREMDAEGDAMDHRPSQSEAMVEPEQRDSAALPSPADGVSFQIAGDLRFYERAEIKDALAYLTLLVDSSDTAAFSRVVNSPRRGIGATSLGRLVDCASTTGKPVWDAAAEPESVPGLAPTAMEALGSFMAVMERLRERAVGGASVGDLLTQTLEETGYTEALEAEGTTEAQGRLENLGKLFGVAREYDATADGGGSVEEFLQQLALGAAPTRAETGGEEADAYRGLDPQGETATVEARRDDAAPLDDGDETTDAPLDDGDETSDWVDGDLQLAIARAQLPGTTEFRVLGPVRNAAGIRRRFAWKTDDELAASFEIATEARARATMDGSEAEAAYWKVLVRIAVSEAATRPDFGNLAERDEEGGRRERRLREKRLRALAEARQAALRGQ